MFSFEMEGCPITVSVSQHANMRMKQRMVNKYASFGSIVAVGEDLLDMRHGEEFCIIDKELNVSIVCAIHARGSDIDICIITVLDNHQFYVKSGTRVYKLEA